MKDSLMKRTSVAAALLGVLLCCRVVLGQPRHDFNDMREAMAALKTAKNPSEAEQVRAAMARTPVRDHDDLMAVYAEAKRREDETPLFANEKEFDEYVRNGQAIAVRLKTSDPKFQDDIAAIIDSERESWSSFSVPMIPIGKMSLRDGAKSAQRVVRVHSLFDAAGATKNDKARAALWRVVDSVHDAYYGQLAVATLGKIGNSQDLDRLIQMVEQNPRAHFQFMDFGSMAIPRLIDEIKNKNLPKETQGSLALGLREVASHDSLSTFVPLIHDNNPFIAREAELAVGHNLRSSDDGIINSLLRDNSLDIKSMAMSAIDGRAWDPRFVPMLIDQVQHDDASAAAVLGHHKVVEAISVLKKTAQNSSKAYMRRAAQAALTEINGK